MKIRIGAHVSAAGGYSRAFARASSIGASVLQIFSSSPRIWKKSYVSPEDIAAFKQAMKEHGIAPVYFHASYLVNLASEGRVGTLSEESLIAELTTASLLGVRGSIVHVGSFKGSPSPGQFALLVRRIRSILRQTPPGTLLILENAGNNKIGQKIDELAGIIRAAADPRVRICLDTCHLYSAGYDIKDARGYSSCIEDFDKHIGLHLLEVLHLNDSRDPLGSSRDRHENIGEGTLGKPVFERIVNDPRLNGLPLIIETPGFDGKGPDQRNIEILKELIHG